MIVLAGCQGNKGESQTGGLKPSTDLAFRIEAKRCRQKKETDGFCMESAEVLLIEMELMGPAPDGSISDERPIGSAAESCIFGAVGYWKGGAAQANTDPAVLVAE